MQRPFHEPPSGQFCLAVILGQAKRSLGALIVPSQDALDAVGGDVQSGELRSTIQVRTGYVDV